MNEERKGNQWKMKVRKMGEKGKHESEKYSRCAKREVWRKYRVRCLEEVPEVWGKYRTKRGKIEVRG